MDDLPDEIKPKRNSHTTRTKINHPVCRFTRRCSENLQPKKKNRYKQKNSSGQNKKSCCIVNPFPSFLQFFLCGIGWMDAEGFRRRCFGRCFFGTAMDLIRHKTCSAFWAIQPGARRGNSIDFKFLLTRWTICRVFHFERLFPTCKSVSSAKQFLRCALFFSAVGATYL
jgi:hypothetical protein